MHINKQSRDQFTIWLQDYEILVFDRYIKVLNNSAVIDIETLLASMMQQQVDFVLDSLVEEANISVEPSPIPYWAKLIKFFFRKNGS